MIADQNSGIGIEAIKLCAEIICRNANIEPDGFANLRFSALANVNPYGPFFPGSYHQPGQPPAIGLAIEGADEVVIAFQERNNFV